MSQIYDALSTKNEVQYFLNEFFAKYGVFGVIYRDRPKNAQTLLDLEMSPSDRGKVVESIKVIDYCEGPLDDQLYGVASMWVFGKTYKKQELYIKISMGAMSTPVICISFHLAEHQMIYPLKDK